MPNWNHIVRDHLAALRLPPEREIEIVEELALHLEAAHEAALVDGLSEAEAVARTVQDDRSADFRRDFIAAGWCCAASLLDSGAPRHKVDPITALRRE
jgi:hypothetical protein